MFYLMLILLVASAFANFDPQKIENYWSNEKIYFLPQEPKKSGAPPHLGEAYRYEDQKCFRVSLEKNGKTPVAAEGPCSAAIRNLATEPYQKIADSSVFLEKFTRCAEAADKKCLRGFISRYVHLSFGYPNVMDQRDYIFSQWKAEDYKRLATLVKQGTKVSASQIDFPASAEENAGKGLRGSFKLVDGGWLLTSYLGGD